MIRLLWRSDVHLADSPPQARIDNWAETVLGKLAQVGRIATAEQVTAVLDGGDFFHVKSPSRNTHRLIQRVAEVHAAYPCPVYGNVGNHDCKFGDYKHLPEQPLGVLFKTGVFRPCYDEHEVRLEVDGVSVRIVGIPYHGTTYDLKRFGAITKGDEDYLVAMAHVLASKSGGTMFEGEDIIRYSDLAGLDPDVWCFGHWHKNQGVVEIAPGRWVVNTGSLTRGALTEDELSRIPVVTFMEFGPGGISIREIPLDVAPAQEVFDLAGRVRMEAQSSTMEALVEAFKIALASDVKVPIEDSIRKSDMPDPVKERALHFWEQAGT